MCMQISELLHLYTHMTKIRNISCTLEAPFRLLSGNTPGEVSTSLTSITQLCLHLNFTEVESNSICFHACLPLFNFISMRSTHVIAHIRSTVLL